MSRFDCDEHMSRFLKELPKCEHHVHLEGTLEPELVFELAARNNIELPEWFPTNVEACNDRYNNFKDLQDFLDHYYVGMSVLVCEDDFFCLAKAYFDKAHKDGCLHSEVFFDPQAHTERGVLLEVVVKGFARACKYANEEIGTTNKLIMCLLRHLPAEDGLKTIHDAKQYYSEGTIHGLGLDSAEAPFPPELFEECFRLVSTIFPDVGLTAHAGEEGDHSYVSNSLDLLQVTRIDHGVNSRHNPELVKRLANDNILLSLCPLSNVKLQVVKDVAELPIDYFFESKIPFSINSDDPAYFGGYILDNYIAVHTRFGFSLENWCTISKNSIEGSWCDEARKQELKSLVDQVFEKYRPLIV